MADNDPEDAMPNHTPSRRTVLALAAAPLLLALAGSAQAAPEPPALPRPDWWALCITASPGPVQPPKVCIPDLTK